jgi:hypothetical protein
MRKAGHTIWPIAGHWHKDPAAASAFFAVSNVKKGLSGRNC